MFDGIWVYHCGRKTKALLRANMAAAMKVRHPELRTRKPTLVG